MLHFSDNLGNLIESAHEHGVTFVYAISPGLDISFSNSKDVMALKRKLEQVGFYIFYIYISGSMICCQTFFNFFFF